MQVFLVHGEYSAQQTLAGLIAARYNFKVMIPEYLEETILEPGRELKRVGYPDKAVPRIDWEQIMTSIGAGFAELREKEAVLKSKPWLEQTEIRDRLLELDRVLKEISREV